MDIEKLEMKSRKTEDSFKLWNCYIINANYEEQKQLVKQLYDFFGEIGNKFWYIRKSYLNQSHLRVRFPMDVQGFEKFLLNKNYTTSKVVYEPEVYLFGGQLGLEICHKIFCEITELCCLFTLENLNKDKYYAFIAWYSNFCVNKIIQDDFERWDCWKKILELRAFDESKYKMMLLNMISEINLIIRLDIEKTLEDVNQNIKDEILKINTNLIKLFEELQRLYYHGKLTRGIRGIVSCLIIFMWNILGVQPGIQAGYSYSFSYLTSPDRGYKHGDFSH
ncbi:MULTISPECIES: thiopeptide-type bacteriocin biosynthesis protein [unclassified Lysinibacillus]|uniref:thiopeptide-type bacteriocin biosynthesis protein n=1 Tax=unclassified Lysinibacillus TaxID=2636778 RepID=UPI00381554BA